MSKKDFRRAQDEVRKIAELEQRKKKRQKYKPQEHSPSQNIQPYQEIKVSAITVKQIKPGEQVIYQSKPHWIQLTKPALLVFIGLFCTLCSILPAITEPQPGQPPPPQGMINTFVTCSVCIFVVALVSTILTTLNYINSDFILTNKRLIYKKGGFKTKTHEIYLGAVDNVYVETPFMGKILGYGTVVIGSGAAIQQLPYYANPQGIRHRIAALLE